MPFVQPFNVTEVSISARIDSDADSLAGRETNSEINWSWFLGAPETGIKTDF
jgi:hypothetical protein